MGMIMHDDVPYGSGTSYTQGTGIAINNNVIAVDADNTPTENSEKPVKSKGVYSALESNSAKSASLLKSTVGWTGKNRLDFIPHQKSVNNGTITIESDGTVVVNGTFSAQATARYDTEEGSSGSSTAVNTTVPEGACILSFGGNANVGFTIGYFKSDDSIVDTLKTVRGTEETITFPSDAKKIRCYIVVAAGSYSNAKFYPMLRDASITDDTYEPYHENVEEEIEQIYADNGVLGAKNLLKYPYDITAQTLNGMTLTADSNGAVTLNGTTTSLTEFLLLGATSTMLKVADMPSNLILKGSGSADYCNEVIYRDSNNTYISDQRAFNDDMELVIPSNAYYMRMAVLVKTNVTLSNAVLYPMLRLASDPDDTYVPYAMTNRDITEELTVQESVCGILNGTATYNKVTKIGKLVILDLSISDVTLNAWTTLATLDESFRPRSNIRTHIFETSNNNYHVGSIPHGGVIQCVDALTNASVNIHATWITD